MKTKICEISLGRKMWCERRLDKGKRIPSHSVAYLKVVEARIIV
jgi:hypothetical protein